MTKFTRFLEEMRTGIGLSRDLQESESLNERDDLSDFRLKKVGESEVEEVEELEEHRWGGRGLPGQDVSRGVKSCSEGTATRFCVRMADLLREMTVELRW